MRCDLLIHEATFSDELKHEAQAKKHWYVCSGPLYKIILELDFHKDLETQIANF